MHRFTPSPRNRIFVAVVLLLSVVVQFAPGRAEAGFQSAYMRLDRMRINTATGGLVCAQPATVGIEARVVLTFPTTYTLIQTASNWTVTTTNLPSGATPWPGITTASAADNSAKTVTFPSNDLTVGTLYCFNFSGTSTLTTAAAAANSQQASIQTQTAANAVIDLTQVALANNTDDTITITAVVPPSFIFTLSAYADAFTTNLDPGGSVVSTTGVDVEVTTNAKGGWIAWAKDQYAGLHSATANYTIPTAGTVNGVSTQLPHSTEGYVMDVVETTDAANGCVLAPDPEYDGTTQTLPTESGGTLSTTFQPIASCTAPPSPATANGDVITLIERAAISGATPASSDYTDTITVVGAGNF